MTMVLLAMQVKWKDKAPMLTIQDVREILEVILPRRRITEKEILEIVKRLPYEFVGRSKGLKPHPYCIHCGVVKNISPDRAKPLGYYVNELAKMPITKLQMRLIIKELEALGFDDTTRCDDKRAARARRTLSMRSIDNLKDRKMAEYYLSHRILNDLLPNWGRSYMQ